MAKRNRRRQSANDKVHPILSGVVRMAQRSRVHAAAAGQDGILAGSHLASLRASVHKKGHARVAICCTDVGAVTAEIKKLHGIYETTIAGRSMKDPSMVLADLPVEAIDVLSKHSKVRYVSPSVDSKPLLDKSVPILWHSRARHAPLPTLDGRGVVVGIVDSGIDWTHGDFRDARGNTRIRHLWIQDLKPPRKYTEREINAALRRKLRGKGDIARDNLRADGVPHGTHVAAIAAGNGRAGHGRFRGVAPRADLIIVRTDFQSNSVVQGVKWIFEKAKELGRPAVVNLSFGIHLGPHDGTSAYDMMLESLSGPGRIIVAASGNEGNTRIHAGRDLRPGERWVADFSFADHGAQTAIQIDTWISSKTRIMARCRTPFGDLIAPQRTLERGGWKATLEQSIGQNGDQHLFLAVGFSQPPAVEELEGWSLIFKASRSDTARVHCWIPAKTMGQFTCESDRGYLVSEPATSRGTIAAAAFATKSSWESIEGLQEQAAINIGKISYFSSPGPTRDNRKKPEISCPGQFVVSALSSEVRAIPSRFRAFVEPSQKYCLLQGTSQAAPHATGAVALLLQRNPTLDPEGVRSRLIRACYKDRFTGPVWNPRWGFGKLSLSRLRIAARHRRF